MLDRHSDSDAQTTSPDGIFAYSALVISRKAGP